MILATLTVPVAIQDDEIVRQAAIKSRDDIVVGSCAIRKGANCDTYSTIEANAPKQVDGILKILAK
jgi:hypothetical protein